MKKQNKIIISLVGVMILVAIAFSQIENTKTAINNFFDSKKTVVEVLPLPQKDAVDIYFDQKRAEFEEQIELEEQIVRSTLERENKYVEETPEYRATMEKRDADITDIYKQKRLLAEMRVDYEELAENMGIGRIKDITNFEHGTTAD